MNRVITFTFEVQFAVETAGRWFACVADLPGVWAYGQTSEEAIANCQPLALRVVAHRIEHGMSLPPDLLTEDPDLKRKAIT